MSTLIAGCNPYVLTNAPSRAESAAGRGAATSTARSAGPTADPASGTGGDGSPVVAATDPATQTPAPAPTEPGPTGAGPVVDPTPAEPVPTLAPTPAPVATPVPTPVPSIGPSPRPTATPSPSASSARPPAPPTPPSVPAPPDASGGGSAAERFGWGRPTRSDEFTTGVGADWSLYDGAGHNGQGRRSPGAVGVSGGILTINGSPDGTTDGMAWGSGQKYGRWEARVRSPRADPSYHAVALLWPDAENWPVGGEVDFMEMMDSARQHTNFFLHFGGNNDQVSGGVDIDATQWHNWAVEWTPDHIAGFVDGREWFRTTDTSILPPGPMHLTLQLDWFPEGGPVTPSSMQVDWARQYPYR